MTPVTHVTGVQVIAVHARADGPKTSSRHMRHTPLFARTTGWRKPARKRRLRFPPAGVAALSKPDNAEMKING